MSGINSFIISFCSSCILLGFLYMLCPSGSISGSVKYVFCLCFVCCVLGGAVSVKMPNFSTQSSKNNTAILTEEKVATTAQMVFSEALIQQNINFRKITVDTNKLPNGSITISRISIYTNEPTQKINEILGSKNYEVLVINE